MKGKYITSQVLLACLSKPPAIKKDIHVQLGETIAERKKILQLWERSFFPDPSGKEKDIYTQLEETIAERKRIIREWEELFFPEKDNRFLLQDKKAA